ncbi:MAG: hypothetical protein PHP85_03765 [Gallionella sp.]|nr:hypothetical protein [Gallionella sp.]
MLKIRCVFILLGMLSSSVGTAATQVSIGIGLPYASIGINLSEYPTFAVVPGYPVYYAPYLDANLFFYDGMYWLYEDNNWYESSWYNGPWWRVDPDVVPVFLLRIPVRYYRLPPAYFYGWYFDAPPRWGEYWGHDWERHRRGWDRWNRNKRYAPAPLPLYQRQYSGDRYPRRLEHQQEIQKQYYRYQPRDPIVQEHYQEQQRAPYRRKMQGDPDERAYRPQEVQRAPDERGYRPQEVQRAPEERGYRPQEVQRVPDERGYRTEQRVPEDRRPQEMQRVPEDNRQRAAPYSVPVAPLPRRDDFQRPVPVAPPQGQLPRPGQRGQQGAPEREEAGPGNDAMREPMRVQEPGRGRND